MNEIVSLGAGVQSSTLLLMALQGDFRVIPDCAIFADTGWEPPKVYEYLEWLENHVKSRYGFTIHRVSAGNLKEDTYAALQTGKRVASMPVFTKDEKGKIGRLFRQCTQEYKIAPIRQKIRELVGLTKGQRVPEGIVLVNLWMGISFDERLRQRISDLEWITNYYPLVDKRITRWDCIRWCKAHGYPEPPQSACVVCANATLARWRDMRDNDNPRWQEAVEFDRQGRHMPGVNGEVYLNKQGVPLEELDLSTPRDHGQQEFGFGFDDECGAVCGV